MAKKRSKGKIFFIILLVLGVFAVVSYLAVFSKSDHRISVQVSKVIRKTITQTVSAIGQIEPETEVKISSETSGEIIFLGVEEGDTVKKGELLVRIKPDLIESQLDQEKASVEAAKMDIDVNKAELEKSKMDLQRKTELYKKQFLSAQDFDAVKTAYEQANANYQSSLQRYARAKAGLELVRKNAERTTIYSPIDGIVTKLDVEKGENVVGTATMQGTEMMAISDLRVMNAVVDVDENDIVLVNIGDTSMIEVDALQGDLIKGYVIEIGHSAIESNTGQQDEAINFKVKIRVLDDEPRLRPGMSCNVDINTETRYNTLAVPLQAVTVRAPKIDNTVNQNFGRIQKENNNKKKAEEYRPPSVVFIPVKGRAIMKQVKTGISDQGFIEILSGLKENEKIISGSFMAVSKELTDSALIRIDTTNKFKGFGKKF